MTTPQLQVLAKCRALLDKASELYCLDLSHVAIKFDLRGRCAGVAMRRGNKYTIRFNHNMMVGESFDHIINETVPHEIAHIVCFMNDCLGSGHNSGWVRVCIELGGTGVSKHSEAVVYANGNTYEYTSTTGAQLRVSEIYHKRIQQGTKYTYRNNKGTICKLCDYSIVGMRGVSLSEPIAKEAINHPAVIERAKRESTPEVPKVAKPAIKAGVSKASVAQAIMLLAHKQGDSYEHTIAAIMRATGHTRQLARSYFKHYAPKLGIPVM